MTLDRLRDAMHAAPFQPFVIHVSDGDVVEVPHPDFIALMGTSTAIVTSPLEDARPSYRLIYLPAITQLEIRGMPANDT